MSFDLWLWPIDASITYGEASQTLERLLDEEPAGPTPASLLAFQAAMRARFPEAFPDADAIEEDWQPLPGDVIFEMDDGGSHVFLGIPFSCVARVGRAAQEIAADHDLVIVDQQTEEVYMPPRFGGADIDWGTDPTAEELAAQEAAWMAEAMSSVGPSSEIDEDAAHVDILRAVQRSGGEMWSPMGYELTEENILESIADPLRTPTTLQTPEHRASLIADLDSTKRRSRAMALSQLTGWDPDPEVASALRPFLQSRSEFERWQAAGAMARQGATEAMDEVLEVVRLASPGEGASIGSMLLPVRYALELAELIGPETVAKVKASAAAWRGPTPAKAPRHEREWAAELDAMLS